MLVWEPREDMRFTSIQKVLGEALSRIEGARAERDDWKRRAEEYRAEREEARDRVEHVTRQRDEARARAGELEGLLRRCWSMVDHAHDCMRRKGGVDGECDCGHMDETIWINICAALDRAGGGSGENES
jgi:hypothetical protein